MRRLVEPNSDFSARLGFWEPAEVCEGGVYEAACITLFRREVVRCSFSHSAVYAFSKPADLRCSAGASPRSQEAAESSRSGAKSGGGAGKRSSHRLEANLQRSQQERGELHNRLAVACRQASSKDALGSACEPCSSCAESAMSEKRQELPKAQASQRESAELVAKAGHQNRCEQRSNGNLPKQGQMQVCSERKGIQKQRIREPE
ncbi:unnamed protein product [Symbiodinium sp. CCMP2592]|nr:unnamed protein product [Symbiodinium sp. CCMP2592]